MQRWFFGLMRKQGPAPVEVLPKRVAADTAKWVQAKPDPANVHFVNITPVVFPLPPDRKDEATSLGLFDREEGGFPQMVIPLAQAFTVIPGQPVAFPVGMLQMRYPTG